MKKVENQQRLFSHSEPEDYLSIWGLDLLFLYVLSLSYPVMGRENMESSNLT